MKVNLLKKTVQFLGHLDRTLFHVENSIYYSLYALIIPLSVMSIVVLSPLAFGQSTVNDLSLNLSASFNHSDETNVNANVLGTSSKRQKLVKVGDEKFPEVTARSYVIADAKNAEILVAKNENERMAPASTTKLVTALVARDIYETTESHKMPQNCINPESQSVGLFVNESYYVKDLIASMLIFSAGDAACLLSEAKIPYSNFISLMNAKAASLGLTNTKFSNPVGLDVEPDSQYSSAKDLYEIGLAARKDKLIQEVVSTKEYNFWPAASKSFHYNIRNTNDLLFEVDGTVGLKTGYTESAGEVLVYEYKKEEFDLMIVVMGSRNRFPEVKNMLRWVLTNYEYK